MNECGNIPVKRSVTCALPRYGRRNIATDTLQNVCEKTVSEAWLYLSLPQKNARLIADVDCTEQNVQRGITLKTFAE